MPTETKIARDRVQATLLSAATGTTNGQWHDVSRWDTITVHVKGVTSATVNICASCAPAQPADSADEYEVTPVTSDGIIDITTRPKWLKVRVSVYATGTIYAYAIGKISN